jgi:hypothetical protein
MAMGEAAGVAASIALQDDVGVESIDVAKAQAILRRRGADPGDEPAPNATFSAAAE